GPKPASLSLSPTFGSPPLLRCRFRSSRLQPMAPPARPSNATLLARLGEGTARFELLEDPAPAPAPPVWPRLHCFARIGSSLRGGWSAALNKVEHYGVQRVTGDGRCMFRALAKGMAKTRGIPLTPREEVQDADDLRLAVKEVICDNQTERQKYEEAIIAITVDESLKRYCQRIRRPDFWGGESELLVLSRLCRQPIIIYIPEREYRGRGNGFIPIAEYGLEFTKDSKEGKKRVPVRLLYSGKNHYDLLI
uniref:Ubiquitin thioesterase OTU n=6 Tax=Triticinae TaxID=1648030 RepID=A0A453IF83_AEGTS